MLWVVSLATVGLVFDGYDLVVYGTVVSTLLRDPTQIGTVTPALAGALGSYALVGVLVGALLAGSVGDIVGRRKVMLFAYAWFSVGMALTALMTSAGTFGLLRFVTGLGVGALVATTGAIVSEFAPPGKKNLCNAITYCGVPLGSLLAALLAIILLGAIGWRGMFWIGALPLVTLLPLAFFKMPESPAWLLSRGRVDEARAISEKTGVLLSETPPPAPEPGEKRERVGFAGLFSPEYLWPTVLLGLMSAMGLLLVYSLNTWLPELMLRAGYNAKGSLSFLLVLNGGAVIGALIGSRVADRFGPKPVVASCFLLGAIAIALLVVFAWRWMRVRADAIAGRAVMLPPSHVNDLDIRPDSLPDDIAGGARALWQRGEQRAALSLLYRGALSRLVHDHGAAIGSASTEGECVALARAALPAAGGVFFERLVGAWQIAVYAGRWPDAASVAALFDEFDAHFAAGRAEPVGRPIGVAA